MIYRIAADGVLLVHLLFVLFVVAGGALVLWRKRLAWLHAPAVLWAAWIELTGAICPLTPLENRLRILGAQEGYPESFMEHYLWPLLYPIGLTRDHQILLGAAVLLFNLVLYVWMARARWH